MANRIWNDPYWIDLKYQAKRRAQRLSRSRCEFCWLRPISDLHHRTYERDGNELLDDVMAVCRRCHEAIHFGADMRCHEQYLAARGDSGLGITEQWKAYIANP